MLKDEGMEVPISVETIKHTCRKTGDSGMQQYIITCIISKDVGMLHNECTKVQNPPCHEFIPLWTDWPMQMPLTTC